VYSVDNKVMEKFAEADSSDVYGKIFLTFYRRKGKLNLSNNLFSFIYKVF